MEETSKVKTVAEMDAEELSAHIKAIDLKHRLRLRALRALLRVLETE